jgi:type IV pilus assembly protein PilM
MSRWSSLTDGASPAVAVEISSARIAGASLEWRAGRPVVSNHATEPLPGGALTPGLGQHNVHERAAVLAALQTVLDRLGRPRRIGLIVSDVVARVSVVRFEQVPARAQDLDQLIRWQVRKAAPFPIDEAQVSYVRGAESAEGHEFVVSMARRDVIEEYEGLCREAGTHAGIVDLSTFNVINAVLAGSNAPVADWLLVNVSAECASIALLRGGDLIVFRSRATDTDGTLAELVHQTTMYYEDRLKGGGFSRVIVAGATAAGAASDGVIDELRRSLENRVTAPVETVDTRTAAALTDRIAVAPALLDTLAPLVGLLLRDSKQVPA